MVVTSHFIGHRVTGLYVGATNVRRFFPKRMTQIELQLDHLRIECGLNPNFWHDHPEIDDPRLCIWLESKRYNGNGNVPVRLSLVPSGTNSFVLSPAGKDAANVAINEMGEAHENGYLD